MSQRTRRCRQRPEGSRPAGRLVGLVLAVSCLVASAGLPAGARASFKSSVGYAVEHVDSALPDAQTAHRLDGLLELKLDQGPLMLSLTAEPRLFLSEEAPGDLDLFSAGLTEGYIGYQAPNADLQVGRVRLPLETARLSVPYSLETVDAAGRRYGLEGARADLYLDGRRLRVAVVDVDDAWTPVLSLRQPAAGWEASLQALVREGKVVSGAAASGLVGSVVLYGELWAVPDEDGPRYALGATGYWGELLWTAEAARAPFPLPALPDAGSLPMAALQMAYSPTLGTSLSLDGAITLEGEPMAFLSLGASYELVPGRADLEASLSRLMGPADMEGNRVEAALRLYL